MALSTLKAQSETELAYIWFYDEKSNPSTAFLGNYEPCEVIYDQVSYKCSEAAYQAQRFTSCEIKDQFCHLDGPSAWSLANRLKRTEKVREDWSDEIKLTIMKQVVKAKFDQNSSLKDRLIHTESAYLVEHTGRDRFWADGGRKKNGFNHLGRILMEVREELGGKGPIEAPQEYLLKKHLGS